MYTGKSSRLKTLFLYALIKLLAIIVENINVAPIVLVLIQILSSLFDSLKISSLWNQLRQLHGHPIQSRTQSN